MNSSSLGAVHRGSCVAFIACIIKTMYLQSCTEIDETQVLTILKSPLIFTPFLRSVGQFDSSTETKQTSNEPLCTGLLISRTHLQIHPPAASALDGHISDQHPF